MNIFFAISSFAMIEEIPSAEVRTATFSHLYINVEIGAPYFLNS